MNKKSGFGLSTVKRILALLLSLAMFMTISANSLASNSDPYFYNKHYSAWLTKNVSEAGPRINNYKKGDKITITNSKSKVASAKKIVFNNGNDASISYKPRKSGTTALTVKIKRGKKTYTLKQSVHVIKYSNPFESVRFGTKDYKKLFSSSPNANAKICGKKTLSVKTTSEWTLKEISVYTFADEKIHKYKNNRTVSLGKSGQLTFTLQKKKNKNIELSTSIIY